MGYWIQNEKGNSLQLEGEMIWGDAPADIMGNALHGIIGVFIRDRDRPPTEAEVKAGLLFSLNAALDRVGKQPVGERSRG